MSSPNISMRLVVLTVLVVLGTAVVRNLTAAMHDAFSPTRPTPALASR